MKRINHGETVALRKVGNPEGFTMCGWRALDDGVLYRMRKQIEPYSDGTRRWAKDGELRAEVSDSEVMAERKRYEADTGLCAECCGTKETWRGWSKADGHKYGECKECGGTGKAKA